MSDHPLVLIILIVVLLQLFCGLLLLSSSSVDELLVLLRYQNHVIQSTTVADELRLEALLLRLFDFVAPALPCKLLGLYLVQRHVWVSKIIELLLADSRNLYLDSPFILAGGHPLFIEILSHLPSLLFPFFDLLLLFLFL